MAHHDVFMAAIKSCDGYDPVSHLVEITERYKDVKIPESIQVYKQYGKQFIILQQQPEKINSDNVYNIYGKCYLAVNE
jgi:hypothetical protein